MNIKEIECTGGFKIELSPFNKTILSCASTGGHKIELNSKVSSSGRVFCPKGLSGESSKLMSLSKTKRQIMSF